MAFNVNSFRASFFNGGEPAAANSFEARIRQPSALLTMNGIARDLPMRCESASIPGKNLQFVERRTYGPIRKIAYAASYDEITLSFIVSSKMAERNFFSVWQAYIIDSAEGGDISYYDDYVGQIQIVTYDHKGNESLSITLVEAYPISVNPVELNWGLKNDYMKIDVTFAYRYWVDKAGNTRNGLAGLLGNIAGAFQLANNLKDLLRGDPLAALPVALGALEQFDGLKESITSSIGSGISTVGTQITQTASEISTGAANAFRSVSNSIRSIF